MTYLQSLILGIVQGVTEFLPVSSTGHLILASHLLKIAQTDFVKSFEISIQLGSILSVVFLYWRSFLIDFNTLKRVIVAFIPTGILGLFLYKMVKTYLLGNINVVLISLLIGGVILIFFEKNKKNQVISHIQKDPINYRQAFIIGLFQSLAMIPGVSRSAATIIGGLSLGINRKTIVEFSFLLAVPTMLAATGLDFIKNAETFSSAEFDVLAIGFITSLIVSLLSIKWLLNFIKKHTFTGFGIYRVGLAILMMIFLS